MYRIIITAISLTLLVGAGTAHAKLTTGSCLALKRTAWSTLRKCQGTEQAKQLKGKTADLAKCQTRFQDALTKVTAKATTAAIACRYSDNGDSTITDFDTGLMWERKNGVTVTQTVTWSVALTDFLGGCNGTSTDGTTLGAGCSIYRDWRIPTILELQSIVNTSRPGCSTGIACVDPIFEPTAAGLYWSATTWATGPDDAWSVSFYVGGMGNVSKGSSYYVRAVRAGL